MRRLFLPPTAAPVRAPAVGEHDFDWRHAASDTLDRVDPDHFRRAMGMLAALGFVLAALPAGLPHGG